MRETGRRGRRTLSLLLGVLLVGPAVAPGASLAQADEPTPVAVVEAFEATGDAAGADVGYAWEISTDDAQWTLELRGPEGESLGLVLLAEDGAPIEAVRATDTATLYDVALPRGAYRVVVARSGRETLPYRLTATRQAESFDPEPNDDRATAVALPEGVAMPGRLARTSGDRDRYALDVPMGDDQLRDVVVESAEGPGRRLCLLGPDDQPRACRSGERIAALHDLALAPGRHVLEVSGSTDAESGYAVRADAIGERRADREAEPNDEPATASALDVGLGIGGRSTSADPDYVRASVEGDLQLWEIVASGADVHWLTWVRADGTELMRAQPGPDGRAVITDLFLVPGAHIFGVRATGEYAIDVRPLGPPDPDAEREPNDDAVRAQPYGIGQRRTGRLATVEDVDHLRFTVAAPERLQLHLTQPPDAHLDLTLRSGDSVIVRERSPQPGDAIDLDLWLEPGDYLLRLSPRQVSEGAYELTTERLDPFLSRADQEPNDSPAFARAVPGSLTWTGTARGGTSDHDWFVLPPLAEPAPVVVRMDTERPWAKLYAGPDDRSPVGLEQREDGSFVAQEPPAGVPLLLELSSEGPYEVRVESAGWDPSAPSRDPDLDMGVAMETDSVAAYWPEAQRVDGTLSLSNTGGETVELTLEARTSHHAWRMVLPEEPISVAAGATIGVPLSVEVGPDAWAGEPVRVSLATRTADGGLRTAAAVIEASQQAPAVGTSAGWTVPEALLGGLNVASLALGGEPRGDHDATREQELFDGVTPPGAGFGRAFEPLPGELVVDLAGEGPVPIAGTIINPLARAGNLRETLRRFELLLSTDGRTWTSALGGEVTPLPIDQAFVLPEPMPATHAMLRAHTLHGDRSSYLALGEWKVIAVPGSVPDTMPSNIADPVRGGHVVRRTPLANGFDTQVEMLDGEQRRRTARIDERERFEAVIGFGDGRAAQVTELRWQDPEGSLEATRLDALEVHVSKGSPLGPWEPVGTWQLERGADGSVTPLALAEPTWVRYVRLTSPFPEEAREVELPARIEVLERPPDDDYRSILGEWGYASRLGPYEWSQPSMPAAPPADGPDAGDDPDVATPLALGVTVLDRVEIGEDVDWFGVDVPPGQNTLHVDVAGVPTVGVRLALFDAARGSVPMKVTSRPDGGQRHEAVVDPGASYLLSVEQPPFSVVFTFDTSGSMGPFLDLVFEGMREFASDVQPGREAIMIVPFEHPPMLPGWQDQPFILADAINGFVPFESSAAEEGLLASTALLADRAGTRAILVVTDAETSSLDRTTDLWAALEDVRPIIHSVHVGATGRPAETRHLMQSWAAAAGGEYSFPTTHAEMDRAFERLSTRLRRPADYTLVATTLAVDRDPGELSVRSPEGVGPAVALAADVGVAVILDTSGSMRDRLDGRRRIAIARESLDRLVAEALPEGTPLALRTFGGRGTGRAARCRTRLVHPLAPLDRSAARDLIGSLGARRGTLTPIAAALAEVPGDLSEVRGARLVVLVTDGEETCDGDPAAVIEELRGAGVEVRLNIVGFALDDEDLKAQMAGWAEAGGGTYFDAGGAEELTASIAAAVSAPFRVYDPAGAPVATGSVGGEPVPLEVGTYRVEVLVDPPVTFEEVVVEGGRSVELTLPAGPDDG